tara:strand:- start:220 stop:414 length:195 start_codon:yes stop_codon:yes gene_type:complete
MNEISAPPSNGKMGFLYSLSKREEHTTETDENAIQRPPISGEMVMPRGTKTPAATGMPIHEVHT